MAAFNKKTEVLILGGGITGLAIAARLEKAGKDYLLVEASDFGGMAKGQSVNGVALDYGLKSIPCGEMKQNPLVVLKEELGLTFGIESFNETARLFENKSFSDFLGFGETEDRFLVEELSYYTEKPRLLVAGGWKNLTEELLAIIPEKKRITDAYVTGLQSNDDLVISATINGESHITAEKFIYTFCPGFVKDLLPPGAINPKVLQRIARREPFVAMGLDLATSQSHCIDKNIFVLKNSVKEEDVYVLGQFVSNVDPLKQTGGLQVSSWLTLVNPEALLDDENGSKILKIMKKIIEKAFPNLIADVKWERLLVVDEAIGVFNQLTLEKNNTLPGLSNLWMAGSKTNCIPHRNLSAALHSAKNVFESVMSEEKGVEEQTVHAESEAAL